MPEAAVQLPPLMHFPLAKFLATSRGLSIRRFAWSGAPGAHELAWLRYEGGLWWYRDASGERVAESGDVDEHDLLALDWTTLPADCDPAEHQHGLPADAVVFGIRPYDLPEEPGIGGVRDLRDPNAELGAGRCEPPSIPPPRPPGIVPPPVVVVGGGGGTGPGSGGNETGGGGGGTGHPPRPKIPGGGSGTGGGGGSGGGGGGRRRRRRQPSTSSPPSASVTIAASGQAITNSCTIRESDGCGRQCGDQPAYDLEYEYTGATISLGPHPEQPDAIWFYRYYYKGEFRDGGTIKPGDSKDVDGGVRTIEIALGASHTARVSFRRGGQNALTVEASDSVTCPNLCERDPECGQPCDPGGGGGSGGSMG
jgi:hypothetical protein